MVDEEEPVPTASAEAAASSNGVTRLMKAVTVAGGVVTAAASVEALTTPFAKTGTAILSITLAVLALGILLIALYAYRQTKITMTVGQIAKYVAFVLLVGATLTYAVWHHKVIQVPHHRLASSSRCSNLLTITSPANGAVTAHGGAGVIVKITACGLGAHEVGWLFDYDTGDGTYNFDGNGGPIVTTNGHSTFADTTIGNPGDINKLTIITLVLADTSCNQTLAELQSGPPPTTLPSGCQIASRVDVYVTYPTSI